jgi:HD superfamily phosphodiesterase
MVNLAIIENHIESMFDNGLSKKLIYHNIDHTRDVRIQCLAIATEEGVSDERVLYILQVAALYHDTGFLKTYDQHEAVGCEIAREQLPGFGMNALIIEDVCDLIMATRVPQKPAAQMEKIICDADLDYLGRDDFYITSNKLKRELIELKLLNGDHEWEKRQLDFLQSHHYFTRTSIEKRGAKKMNFIKELLKNNNLQIK